MKKQLWIFSFLLCAFLLQSQDKNFEKFAARQDSLCVVAYEKKDDKAYQKLLNEFLTRYNKLDSADKKVFSGTLNGIYYNFCCLYSLQNNKTKAVEMFEKSVGAGYNNYQHVLEDTDLDNIRQEQKFKALARQLRSTGDYLYILKKASAYDLQEKSEVPKFTYQSADDPDLVQLRKYFKLDSIAGGGNDVSQILNLLHWIHNLVPHDGNHPNPVVKNALSMVSECKKEKRGLNCRGLSTVLNECYLALGIPSRFITCMPKDSLQTDPDCHVINMVYCNSLKKWLWIDPTNDAYVMNERGELLSIEEVRERLITDKPLIVNPDANWNRQQSVVKENYLYQYMAKNLYKFNCAVASEYDSESARKGKKVVYVDLLPTEYYLQQPRKTEEASLISGNVLVTYKTNNPALFWTAPGQ